MDSSSMDRIPDAIAAIAAAYVPGVRSVAGTGSGLVTIPTGGIMAGQTVPPYKGEPTESWQHVSNLPAADVAYRTATVTEVTWDIPFRLYVQKQDSLELRRRLAPIYFAYIGALAKHLSVLGLIHSGAIAKVRFTTAADDNWAWLEGHIPLVERLNLENAL